VSGQQAEVFRVSSVVPPGFAKWAFLACGTVFSAWQNSSFGVTEQTISQTRAVRFCNPLSVSEQGGAGLGCIAYIAIELRKRLLRNVGKMMLGHEGITHSLRQSNAKQEIWSRKRRKTANVVAN